MNEAPTPLLLLLLVLLILVIAFSSGTEVAMLSVNRYRVRHRAELGQGVAKILERLLQRPDDWLGVNLVILAAASVFASQAATIIAQRTKLAFALSLTGAVLTILMIVLGELVPKIFAATHAEMVALRSAYIYRTLVLLARPVLWLTSHTAYGVLRLVGAGAGARDSTKLGAEELRAVVAEASSVIPARHREMLLSILDLGQVTVNDIMVPRQAIDGIDVAENWDDIMEQLRRTPHTRLPVFEGELDNLVGMLHMKRVARELARDALTRERLIELARTREPYFVPEGTTLAVQLANFQRNRRRHAFVVNEYGDIEGLVTLEDILEEIVGEFTSDPATVLHKDVHAEKPGVFIVNASATIRALNRALQWHLPTVGPKTLNGLLLEQLEAIPEPGTTVRVGDYVFEVLQIADNAVRTVRVHTNTATA
ncbi:MAG TPA: CNNM domain-containing protein [Steroidobacteraceae bacterium]|nr:CNNM domain-containing protein [Steroidobacteraceae bacterium]